MRRAQTYGYFLPGSACMIAKQLTLEFRIYRERSQNYIRVLEGEVNRLRDAIKERQEAEIENQTLKELMASHNIVLPEGISHEDCPSSSAAELSLNGPPGSEQFLQTLSLDTANASARIGHNPYLTLILSSQDPVLS